MSGSVSTLTPTDLSSSDSSSPQQQAVDPPRTPSPKPSPSPNPAKLAALPFAKPVRGLSRDLAILEAAAEEGSVMMMDLDPLPPTPPAVSKLGLGLGLGMEITRGLGRRASTGSSDLEEAAGLLAVHERGDFAPPAFLSESPGSDVEMEFVDSEQSIEAVAGEIQRKKSPPIDFPYLNAPGRLGHPHPHPHRLLFDAHTASSTREREEEVEQSVAETLIQGEDELLFGSPDAELAPAPTDPHKSILQLDSLPLPISSDIPTDADTLPPTPTTYDAPMMLPLPMHAEEKKGEVEGAKPLPTPPPSPEAEAEMKKKEAGEGGVGWDLRVAAAGQPKNPRPRDRLPPICKEDCGEDAYFVHSGPRSFSLGVADGVGGWTSLGVDPSLFAWDLMNCCKEVAEGQDGKAGVDTERVLSEGYRRVVQEGRVEAGSSTACLLNLDKRTGLVRTTNLGDSGAIIIRPAPEPEHFRQSQAQANADSLSPPSTTGSRATDLSLTEFHVPFRTTDLQHYFNAPYQLSVLPPPMRNDPTNIVDSPADAVTEQFGELQVEVGPDGLPVGQGTVVHGVKEGDVIVLGTDGVWDNLWEEEIYGRLRSALGGLGNGWEQLDEESSGSPGFSLSDDEDDEYAAHVRYQRQAEGASTHGFVLTNSEQSSDVAVEIDRRLEKVAKQLCMDARIAARDARKPSPFSRNARKAGHLHFGGKLDDVTVILAYVSKMRPESSASTAVASPVPSAPHTPPGAGKAGQQGANSATAAHI